MNGAIAPTSERRNNETVVVHVKEGVRMEVERFGKKGAK